MGSFLDNACGKPGGRGGATLVIDVRPVGIRTAHADLGAELFEDARCDVIGRTVGTI